MPKSPARRVLVVRVVGSLARLAVGGAVLYGILFRSPGRDEPFAVAPIRVREPAPVGEPATPDQDSVRRTAAQVETASGVAVVRPDGETAPSAIVIRVPEVSSGKLAAAPDPRLMERTRYGILPRIGADGTRPAQVYARAAGPKTGPRVAVLLSGLGISQSATAEAIAKLPPAVTLAFAPYGSDLERSVAQARDDGHEVMLQVPMEPFDYPDNDPGPHTLTVRAQPQENLDRLHWVMGRFTGYTGIVNFMGAKLTADETALAPILKEIADRGLVLLDDGSSSRSVIGTGVRGQATTARAHLVLDVIARPDAIDRELQRIEELARDRGFAIGTASALPLTIDRVARWAKGLEAKGIQLVPVSAAFEGQARR
jgi:polysaccharide deacetylase 2 family uncharacterized protein YibQ